MRKITKITAVLTGTLFFAAMTSLPVSAQSSQKPSDEKKVLPQEVMKVVEKSCAKCHMDQSLKMAPGGLNFAEWDKYAPEKQAAKAKAVCNAASNSVMPPKNFIKNNPTTAPTQDDIKTLCTWSASFQPDKK